MEQLTSQELAAYKDSIVSELRAQSQKPLVISIMGQTGVGKSTLLRTLFNIEGENVSARPTLSTFVRPATKTVETYTLSGAKGLPIVVHDMPGIGESEETDETTLLEYREYFLHSDVAIWAIHVDNRAITFDAQALRFMLTNISLEQRKTLMSKITFVLTKADVLLPSPWTIGYIDNYAIFAPETEILEILEAKELYYQEKLIKPFGESIVSWTYNDVHFSLADPSFQYDEYTIFYQGFLTRKAVDTYKQQYPQFAPVFDRLYDSYRVISCSSLFKYNLIQLLLVILNKLGPDAIENFRQQFDLDRLNRVPFSSAKELCNIRIFDVRKKRKLFDLSKGIFPNLRDNYLFR